MTSSAFDGLLFCGNILIPSLFPFMVLSSFLIYSGISYYIALATKKITKTVFYLPPITSSTIFLSMIGGYPVGARGIKSLLDEKSINLNQAKQMLNFCVGSGPAFVIFGVGSLMLNSTYYGVVLFISQALSQIIIGIFSGIYYRKNKKNKLINQTPKKIKLNISDALVKSCNDAVKGILNLCGMVILFSAIMGLISNLNLGIIIPIIFEVTTACNEICINNAPLPIMAFALGFGGLSVHFQIYSVIDKYSISKIKFTLMRILQGFLCALFTYISLQIYNPIKIEDVFSNINNSSFNLSLSTTFFGSLALIFCGICFLIVFKKKTYNINN